MAKDSRASRAEPAAGVDLVPLIAAELGLPAHAIAAVMRLAAEGATVPFVARYRKEATGGLDETQIRDIFARSEYLAALEARRAVILAEIERQGQLRPDLRARVLGARTKAELEDLYLPFRPRRRTRAVIAEERGLGPLAAAMWSQDGRVAPGTLALRFVDPSKGVGEPAAALAGARDICAERLAEDAELRRTVREALRRDGVLRVRKKKAHAGATTKFDGYASFEERIARLPPHRLLAIRRGEREGVLSTDVDLELAPLAPRAGARVPLRPGAWRHELELVVRDALERLLLPSVASDVREEAEARADGDAIEVFAANLRELLLAPPFGTRPVLGVDPGQRTGCKLAAVDATGRFLESATIYLVQGPDALARARDTLLAMCARHGVHAVAVGNGTHGRETEAFVRQALGEASLAASVLCVSVNEAGASVYSASDLAREEFPDLDLTVRGAISIARRLQDPLAELVKIDPRSIGVGQYQHDVPEAALARKLDEVIESAVNAVGVELNTASAALLSRVAGIGPALARRIVAHRDAHGRFTSRRALLEVKGLGARTFEQAAGFLRIAGAAHPLDASAVHPERYAVVERMARDVGAALASLVQNPALIARIDWTRYAGEGLGEFTLRDIRAEFEKPGRDPRERFEAAAFREDVRTLEDLAVGMLLEGVVTNITAFGAFVDVGVHQDGLVHISELADRFVRDPHEVVRVGQRLAVRVLSIDLDRRRIGLSAKRPGPREPAPPAAKDAAP